MTEVKEVTAGGHRALYKESTVPPRQLRRLYGAVLYRHSTVRGSVQYSTERVTAASLRKWSTGPSTVSCWVSTVQCSAVHCR